MDTFFELIKHEFALPLENPVLSFALILFIILLSPIVLKKLNIPGIIGLIISGVIIGPKGFNIIENNSAVELFSTIGLLYIMFIAGLDLDMQGFKANKNKSLLFGLFTFVIPFVLGFPVCYYLLGYDFNASFLTSIMFSTHTLVAYPIVSRFGVSKNKAVAITVGGTILTDTAVLVILAGIIRNSQGALDKSFFIQAAVSLVIFLSVMFFLIPRITRWFFQKLESENYAHYIFVLSVVFLSAFLAEISGLESIIGAFVAGLALNRLIPHSSALMNRIDFIGNSLFIPFFLISVGMIVDVSVIFSGPMAIIVAVVLTIVSLAGKWLAAFFTQIIFKFSGSQRQLIFGLSSSHAAATLAIILVGYKAEIIDENILNGTIILILCTCVIASFATQNAARKIATTEINIDSDLTDTAERILVPISNPIRIEQLINFSILIKDPKSPEPLYPLTVVADDEKATENLASFNSFMEKAKIHASSSNHIARVISRIDTNIADGIARTAKELMITKIILGWHGRLTTIDFFFGTLLENILAKTGQMIIVTRIIKPLNYVENIHVLIPPAAELELGFAEWVKTIFTLSKQTNSKIFFWGYDQTHIQIKEVIKNNKFEAEYVFRTAKCVTMLKTISGKFLPNDLLVIINARRNSLSYNRQVYQIPSSIDEQFVDNNFIIIYPEQETVYKEVIDLQD
ncbi:MAG: cation:proton antiporter [Bacteroidales bacterium]|jgi:Kef-type K+ transport system membrane component KefB|nr:cation:proton antiporter [Bacteroidales bacterium]